MSSVWGKVYLSMCIYIYIVLIFKAEGRNSVIMSRHGLRFTGKNVHYGTPTNPKLPSHVPGGSSSGSAVAVASKLVDFALGMDLLPSTKIFVKN